MNDVTRVRVVVRGRVQGVAFRAHTQFEARRLGLTGWVQNLPDGAVEFEAQGTDAAVAALVGYCRRGPPSARVDELSEVPCSPTTGERGFAIRR